MDEKNELNDIILNKGVSTGSNKKIILAVATLGIILIIVVMLMSTLTPDAKDNLPQPIPVPVHEVTSIPQTESEPLFEEVEVIEEDSMDSDSLDMIAQRLKQESIQSTEVVQPKRKTVVTKRVEPAPKRVVKKEVKRATPKASKAKHYYIQVGSFSRYKPSKEFLNSIVKRGYKYKFHKVGSLNKVLIGPFYSERKARIALRSIKRKIEAGAFLTKI